MLEALRRGASSWLARILLSVLVLSFALWGVPEFIRQIGPNYLAKVGETTISVAEFQQAYQNEINDISRQAGRRISAEQARAFNLGPRVLERLVNFAAVEGHALELGLALSDDTLAEGIRREPNLQGPDGKFSKANFDALLRQIGLSEQGFLALRRRDELRQELVNAIFAGVTLPKPLVEKIYAYREEKRVVEHLTIDPDKAIKIPEPDEATLLKIYEDSKREYMTPEYRKLIALVVGIEEVKDRVAITEEDVKATWEQIKDTFNTPEKRRIQQISFKDKAAAETARAALAAGKSFTDVAKDSGATETDITLGLLAKAELLDPKLADAAFSLEKDKVSDVVEGRFTTALLRVTEIVPGVERSFDDVKAQVREQIAKERSSGEIQKLHDEVDEARNAGKTLKEIADILKVKFVEIPAADRTGKTPAGAPAVNPPDGVTIAATGFSGDVGLERDAVELPSGGYAWVDVLGVTPPEQRPFEAVKDEVKVRYLDAERRRALAELGSKLTQRINNGETFAAIAGEVGGKPETTPPIARTTTVLGLSQAAVTQAFALPKGRAGNAESRDQTSRTLLRVVDIIPAAAPSAAQLDTLSGELRTDLQNDLIAVYVQSLRDRLGVEINRTALDRAIGAETQP